MAKIIFARYNVKFYENMPHRRSYWNPLDGPPTKESIEQNIQDELTSLYPDSTDISNKMNITVRNEVYRTSFINTLQSYKDIYPNSFSFWNNINHAKIEYDDGTYEYLYIVKRDCKNLATNLWGFTFKVDLYRTYWSHILPVIYNSNKEIYIAQGLEDRFDKDGVMTILKTKNSIWNKPAILQKYNPNFVLAEDNSQVPWDDIDGEKYIYDYRGMRACYSKNVLSPACDYIGYPYTIYVPSGQGNANTLTQYYGTPNVLWYLPIINNRFTKVLSSSPFKLGVLDDYKPAFEVIFGIDPADNKIEVTANTTTGFRTLDSQQLISFNQAIKPTFVGAMHQDVPQSEYGYKIRKNTTVNNSYSVTYIYKDIIHGVNMVIHKNSQPPLIGNDSKLNNLCDERLNTDSYLKELFIKDLKSFNKDELVLINNEPILYLDNFFNIEYKRSSDTTGLIISPLHYFFEDNIEDFSIYIKGYQYIQPDISYLFQWVENGIYKLYNKDGKSLQKNVMFNPELQSQTSKLLQYLLDNKSRINSGLINSTINAATSLIPGAGSIKWDTSSMQEVNEIAWLNHESASRAVSTNTNGWGTAGNEYHPVNVTRNVMNESSWQAWDLGSFIPIYSAIKGTTGLISTAINTSATLSDIARMPNNINGIESNILRQTSNNATWTLHWLDINIRKQIVSYIQQTGYIINKMAKIRDYIGNRIYYEVIQTSDIKVLLNENVNISDGYKEYFSNLLTNRITLWHDNYYNIEIGDYSKENWEVNIYHKLLGLKTVNIEVSTDDILSVLPNENIFNRKIYNYDELTDITLVLEDESIATAILDQNEKQITITTLKEGETKLTITALNANESKNIKIKVTDGRVDFKFDPYLDNPITTSYYKINFRYITNWNELINPKCITNNASLLFADLRPGPNGKMGVRFNGKIQGQNTVSFTLTATNAKPYTQTVILTPN